MQFTTRIPIPKSNSPIGYESGVVSLGSCFAVNIGEKFDHFKFRNTTNPFGILFHPLALANFIAFAVNQKTFTENDIFFHNERWHCFDAHSDLSHPHKETLLGNLNNAVASANAAIKSATHLIITLGTAWVYRHKPTGSYVANCHKVPQKEFNKDLVHIIEVEDILTSIIKLLNRLNPELQVIFTVSPVRHIKDGFTENQWSKANLIAGVHETLNPKHGNTNCTYFPSYEIMMDELRDYRFYGSDML
ncbi:MAG: GSCFA domain-containing protein, partial [Flavobacterium sp.]